MALSPLLLEGYYVEEISVSVPPEKRRGLTLALEFGFHPKLPDPDDAKPIPFDVQVNYSRNEQEPSHYGATLTLETHKHKLNNYWLRLVLVGFFRVAEGFPVEHAETLVKVNGPSLLYSAARELLAMITSRGPYPAIVLPTVTFQTIAEKSDQQKGKGGVKSKKPSTKSKKGRSK